MNIVSPYPVWYFIFCILLGAIYAFVLYRKDKKLDEFNSLLIGLLAFFRIVSVSIICVLLLSPLVKYFSRTVEKPIVVIATDNSSSMMMNTDSSSSSLDLNESISSLRSSLAQQFSVETFLFDQEPIEQDSFAKYDGSITNYQHLFSALEDRFVNRNVSGLVLISDGIYNQGSNPLYLTNKLSYPIYTVAVGDTKTFKDAILSQVRNNKIAFLDNNFPVEFDLKILDAKNEKISFRVIKNENVVFSESFITNSDDYLKTIQINLEANQVGVQKYTIEVLPLDKERNLINNRLDFYIDILDGRQKVSLLAVAPHPDLAAIKRSIKKNKNYELKSALLDDFENHNDADLIILHNSSSIDQPLSGALKNIISSDVPLFILGDGWDNLGVQFGIAASFSKNRSQQNETYPQLNQSFSLFTISEELEEQLSRFPPLNGFSANVDQKNANTTLFYQQIGKVKTKFPLLVFYEKEGRKVGRLFANGIWKWAMNDFVDNQSHENFNELISKIIQYLAIKSDRSNFRVNTSNEYFENEEIVFDAQVFNQSYELVNEEDVDIKLIDEDDKQYKFSFNRNKNAYQLSIPALPASRYKYIATTNLQGITYNENGTFTVKELKLEQIETIANHNLLYQLSEQTGGKLVYPENIQKINELFAERSDINSISYVNEEVEDLINIRWIFFVIAGLLIIEWFIRKRGGAY
ncbi:MAG: hypothetical protein RJQ00_07905 [Vicingaceae bacterium]